MKIDANFEGKMTTGFITDMRNLMNFNRALRNFKVCPLRNFVAEEVYVELKNYRGVMCHDTEG